MRAFLWLMYKDFLLLFRDKINLLILFIMPMFFVLTITLLQAPKPQDANLPIAIASYDHAAFFHPNGLSVTELSSPSPEELAAAKQLVAEGQEKLLVIIPKNTQAFFTKATQHHLVADKTASPLPTIQLFFDPALPPALQTAMTKEIEAAIRAYQMKVMANVVSEVLGTNAADDIPTIPLSIHYAGSARHAPNAVQQNVPAWALFGMFFISLPLASIMLKEREHSVLLRLYVAPVSKTSLLLSRLLAFMSVNFLQLCLMLMVGKIVMPWFGLPALDLSHHLGLIILIGILCAWAATSFGLLIGACCQTIEQASALAPLLIVLASAVGGIMIPIYFMPPFMQSLAVLSPLEWGHEAFLSVFVRNANLPQLMFPLGKLAVFSTLACVLALWRLRSRD